MLIKKKLFNSVFDKSLNVSFSSIEINNRKNKEPSSQNKDKDIKVNKSLNKKPVFQNKDLSSENKDIKVNKSLNKKPVFQNKDLSSDNKDIKVSKSLNKKPVFQSEDIKVNKSLNKKSVYQNKDLSSENKDIKSSKILNTKISSQSKDIKVSKRLNNKKLFYLYTIKKNFGISDFSITKICKKFGLNNRIQIFKVKLKTKRKIIKLIEKLTKNYSLKNIGFKYRTFTSKRLKNYRGARLSLRYPVRGQRTHTNGKTRKRLGKRRLHDLN